MEAERASPRYPDHLMVTDAELLRRLGVPENLGHAILRELDDKPAAGFPPKLKLWGNRRYWPAVRAYFDVNYGLSQAHEPRRLQRVGTWRK